jgi:hypothetical protein
VKKLSEKVDLLPVDASFDVKRGIRWSRQTCADGLIRTVYNPISPRLRCCQDCHFFEASPLKPDDPKLPHLPWCLRNCPKDAPLELKVDPFEQPKTCGKFMLVGITKGFKPWIGQTVPNGPPGHEQTAYEFCRSWNGDL